MIVKNNILPVRRFPAMAIWPIIFVRKDWLDDLDKLYPKTKEYRYKRTMNHEEIHFKQQKELFVIGFFVLYFINWIIELIKILFGGDKKAYSDIIFEREAKANQSNFSYLANRKSFAFIKYLKLKS